MTRDEYKALPALNFSLAKELLRSPAHYTAALQEPEDPMKFVVGRLAHAMVLEGKCLADLYAIKPAGMRFSTKEGKAWRDAQTLPILKEEDRNAVQRMADEIAKHPIASQALRLCPKREAVCVGNYRGVNIKGIVDATGSDKLSKTAITEVKTTIDARPRAFAKRVTELDYDMQCAFYRALLSKETEAVFCWIAVENSEPHAVNVFYPSSEMIDSGISKMELAIATYQRCQETGDWSAAGSPEYPLKLQELVPPRWRISEMEMQGAI